MVQEKRENRPLEVSRVTKESRQFVIDAMRNKKSGKQGGSPSPSDDSAENIVNPSSAKKAKLSSEDQESLELTGKTDIKLGKILNGGKYRCSECPTLNKNMSLVQFCSHLIFHAKRPYKCSICSVHWSSAAELEKNPFAVEMRSNEHVCSVATLVKVPPDGKCNPGKIWSCKWCPDTKFELETERDSHEDAEHSMEKIELEIDNKCLSCSKVYRSFEEWLLHRVLEHPQVAATSCLYCDYTSVIQTEEKTAKLKKTNMLNEYFKLYLILLV